MLTSFAKKMKYRTSHIEILGSSDFSVDTLSPLFGKDGPGEILRITNTTIFFQEHSAIP
jgi:hypothetical protein